MTSTDLAASTARISFRQPVTGIGFVDAGWWPRSSDLTAELPALFEVFWTAGRDMTRIRYDLATWDLAPRRMEIEGRRVHLGGFRGQNPLLVSVSDARHEDVSDIFVVRWDTEPALAARLLTLASESGNHNTPEHMLELARS